MLAGMLYGDRINTGRSHGSLAKLRMEEIMGSVTIWWCRRSQAPRQHRCQAVDPWRLRGVAVGISLPLLALVATVAYGQRLLLTPSFSLEERYDDNIFET